MTNYKNIKLKNTKNYCCIVFCVFFCKALEILFIVKQTLEYFKSTDLVIEPQSLSSVQEQMSIT